MRGQSVANRIRALLGDRELSPVELDTGEVSLLLESEEGDRSLSVLVPKGGAAKGRGQVLLTAEWGRCGRTLSVSPNGSVFERAVLWVDGLQSLPMEAA